MTKNNEIKVREMDKSVRWKNIRIGDLYKNNRGDIITIIDKLPGYKIKFRFNTSGLVYEKLFYTLKKGLFKDFDGSDTYKIGEVLEHPVHGKYKILKFVTVDVNRKNGVTSERAVMIQFLNTKNTKEVLLPNLRSGAFSDLPAGRFDRQSIIDDRVLFDKLHHRWQHYIDKDHKGIITLCDEWKDLNTFLSDCIKVTGYDPMDVKSNNTRLRSDGGYFSKSTCEWVQFKSK